MKLKFALGRLAWWLMGIGFVAICTLVVAPSVYHSRNEDNSAQAAMAVADEAEDVLRKFTLEHEQLRSLQLNELDEIINSENSSRELIDSAQKEKMDVLRKMEIESTISGILHARGYTDAAVSAGDEYVNIMIRALQAQAEDVTRILELVITQTDTNADNIKIIPVN